MALFSMLQMTRINYFVATIRAQTTFLLDSPTQAAHLNNIFDVALPLGGVAGVPLIGAMLDSTSTPLVLGLLVFSSAVIGVLGMLPYMWAACAHIALFVLFRPFFYTAVSDYCAKVFSSIRSGKSTALSPAYGPAQLLAGSAGLANTWDDPVPVNLLTSGLTLGVGGALVTFVWQKSREMGKKSLEEEAETAEE